MAGNNNIKIEVVGNLGKGSSGGNTPPSLDRAAIMNGGNAVGSGAVNAMQTVQNNGNPAPLDEKGRRESLSWMLQRNNYEKTYNQTLNDRLNTLKQMAQYGGNPGGNYGGGRGSGGGGGGSGNQPNTPNSSKTFMGLTAGGWGSVGTAIGGAGLVLNAMNYQALNESRLQASAAQSRQYFDVQAAGGNYSKYLYDQQLKAGAENAPSKFGMVASDALQTIGGATATVASPFLGAAGLPVAAGGISLLANNLPKYANYGANLEERQASATLEAQQAEINKTPVRKALLEDASVGSQKTVKNSMDFLLGLSDTEYGNLGGKGFGELAKGSSSAEAQKIFVRNMAEGVARGMDMSNNAKELSMLTNMLAAGQSAAGVRTEAGAEGFNKSYLRSFADTSTVAGLEAGASFNQFKSAIEGKNTGIEGAAGGAYLEGTFGTKLTGGRAHSAFEEINQLTENEINADNPAVQAAYAEVQASGSKETMSEFLKKAKGLGLAKRVARNPRLSASMEAVRKMGSRYAPDAGMLSLSERSKQLNLKQDLVYATGEADNKPFKTRELGNAIEADTRGTGGLSAKNEDLIKESFGLFKGSVEEFAKAIALLISSATLQNRTKAAYEKNMKDIDNGDLFEPNASFIGVKNN